MPDSVPEPVPVDEDLALGLLRQVAETGLRRMAEGEVGCRGCHFLLAGDAALGHCWHPDVGRLVDHRWRCDRWSPVGSRADRPTRADRGAADRRRRDRTAVPGWRPHPHGSQRCGTCRHCLDPTQPVSYCWHPAMRTAVDADHWCAAWAAIPGRG